MVLTFKEPVEISVRYRIVTPMFIGDASQQATDISPAAVKGALRFWWRALNWGRIRSGVQTDNDALMQLHQEESELFGSSAEEGRPARFRLRVDATKVKKGKHTDWPKGGGDPSAYMGFGLWESGKQQNGNLQSHRQYIAEDQVFEVSLSHDFDLDKSSILQLSDALKAWGLFGGLGSRSRRAFGSVAIESIGDISYQFSSRDQFQEGVDELFLDYQITTVGEPMFTAVSKDSRFAVTHESFPNARSAHAMLGQSFKDYRGQPSDLRGDKKRVFGMPYAEGGKEEKDARRASPLLFHVHPIGKHFVGSALFLPAEFHSDVALKQVDYSLITKYLTRLGSGGMS